MIIVGEDTENQSLKNVFSLWLANLKLLFQESSNGKCNIWGMQSNMNTIMVWAWMLWSSDAVEHGHYYGLGMDALVIGRSQTKNLLMVWAWMLGHQMQSKKNVTRVWAWMPWSSDAVGHERYYGLGAREYTSGCCVMPPVTTTT